MTERQKVDDSSSAANPSSSNNSAVTLRLLNVTDTYKFDNFPSLKTLIEEKKNEKIGTVGTSFKSIMSGDFLAPYLLSSYDEGEGMIQMFNEVPIDILTWGNHDVNDLSDAAVMKRVQEYTAGIWINSNMTEHPTFAGVVGSSGGGEDQSKSESKLSSGCQVRYHVEEIKSLDGTNIRRVGFVAVITNDPKLFKNCNPGMKKWGVQDPWETIRELMPILYGPPHHCDLIIPICHLYEREDAITCKEFDFPIILSGHDHHVVDEVIHGTRLLKAGSDCDKAILMDITWADNSNNCQPEISAEHLTVADWTPNPEISQLVDEIQSVLKPLMHTKLAEVPTKFIPLSTKNERGFFSDGLEDALKCGTQCTMGQFILSLMRDALNTNDNRLNDVDACIMKGGNIKCSQDWPPDRPFTLAMLFALWSPEKQCHIFTIPGNVLQGAFVNIYDRPHNGWIHYDDGIQVNIQTGLVTHVAGKPLIPDKLYRIASGNDLQRASDGAVIGDYLKGHPEHMPEPELAIPVSFVIIQHAVKTIWRKLWKRLDPNKSGELDKEDLTKNYDFDDGGNLNKTTILGMIKDDLQWPIHEDQDTLVDRIFDHVGLDGTAGTNSLSLEHLNDMYQAHQGRPSGAWFFSRSSGVYGSQLNRRDIQNALKDLEHLDF